MGEASGCLMRSLSQPSPISGEYKEGDPLRALTTSISFGRFMKEPLDWEKWSSFTHNRNLEEIEKFSKPGSVAAKKAYFEAHYKKIAAKKKAEASLEQESDAPNRSPEPSSTNEVLYNSSMDSDLANKQQNGAHTYSPEHKSTNEIFHDSSMDSKLAKSDSLEVPRLSIELVCPVHSNGSDMNVEANEGSTMEREQSQAVTEEVVLSKSHIQVDTNVEANEYGREPSLAVPEEVVLSESPIQVELWSQLGNSEKQSEIMTIQEEKTPFKDATNQGDKVLSTKKKPAIPPPKSSVNNGAPKLQAPVKSSIPVHPRMEDTATSNSKKAVKYLMERKRLIPQSLHMSINFGSHARDSTKRSSPVLLKTGNSKISKTLVKSSKDKQTQRAAATTGVSMNGEVSKHSLVIPQQENKRSRTPLDHSVRESRTVVGKSQSLSVGHSESLGACAKKQRPPTVSSSFVLRSEERAAKRKEFIQKLEDKVNATETVNIQRQTKSKIPPTRPRSPNLGRKPSTCSRPPRGSTFIRTDHTKNFIERNKQNLTRSVTSLPKKKMGENTSPNIQL